jgi:hypothetical protein
VAADAIVACLVLLIVRNQTSGDGSAKDKFDKIELLIYVQLLVLQFALAVYNAINTSQNVKPNQGTYCKSW